MDTYIITVGRSRTDKIWKARSATWDDLAARLANVRRTPESASEYNKMTSEARGRAKDVGGFVGGRFAGTARKADEVAARSLITLDIDHGNASTVGIVEDMMEGTAWCLYSTHSHTARTPRYRLVVPLSREVSPDEYIPIARRLADDIGIALFDPSTYEPGRLMYWPSASRDAEFVYRSGKGAPYDADEALATYHDWRDASEWPAGPQDGPRRKRAQRMENPEEKKGIIGAFCREYDIPAAIEAFLPGVYKATARPDRYTYAAGSTASGLVVYDSGRFAFSNHGTDPAFGREVNAWDLVRIHRFGGMDSGAAPDTPVNRLPSYTAMKELAESDRRTAERRAREKGEEILKEFGDVLEGSDADWTSKMQMDDRGRNFIASPYNFGLIMDNDPRLKGTVRRDIFISRDIVSRDLPWRKAADDQFWNNSDDGGLIDYVSRCYRLVNKTALLDAHDLSVSRNAFHPVRDYLNALVWDGTPRLDTAVIDYLGAADNELTRAMTRKHLTAAVARVMRPGIKYDYTLALTGPEGIGKSTLIRKLGRQWFDDSLVTIEGKEGMECLRGKWLIEIGELTSYKKSTAEAYKAFLSKQEDAYRPAYGRRTEVFPRQCVFFATTNEAAFLKGDTGNRRFWIIECGADIPQRDVFTELEANVDQIWAEAVARWREGEPLYLDKGLLDRAAKARQETHNELMSDDRKGLIGEFLDRRLPTNWESLTTSQRQEFFRTGPQIGDNEPYILRETISAIEVLNECIRQPMDERTRYRTREINQILRDMDNVTYAGLRYISGYGRQRVYEIRRNAR